jgi:hypothetical protein
LHFPSSPFSEKTYFRKFLKWKKEKKKLTKNGIATHDAARNISTVKINPPLPLLECKEKKKERKRCVLI